MTELRKHQEQFERIKRWYERIKEIDQGIPPPNHVIINTSLPVSETIKYIMDKIS